VCVRACGGADRGIAGAKLYELKPPGLEGRFFGGVTRGPDAELSPSSGTMSKRSGDHPGDADDDEQSVKSHKTNGSADTDDSELQTAVGEGMLFKEDNYLTSANLCRWVIDYKEIALGKQVRSISSFSHAVVTVRVVSCRVWSC
jgi:hypothetical protein